MSGHIARMDHHGELQVCLLQKKIRNFFEKIMQEEILSHFAKKQPNILYAPTWQDYERFDNVLRQFFPHPWRTS